MVIELKYAEDVYRDAEDSWLIQESVKEFVEKNKPKRVLDLGTGTGILAIQAKLSGAKEVWAADVNQSAVNLSEKNAKLNKVSISSIKSNLFSSVSGEFDLIIFNPPYLPGEKFQDLDGGPEGIELTALFLMKAKEYLSSNGKILLVASSLANFEKLKQKATNLNYKFEIIKEKKFPFEQLFILILELQ